MSLSEEQRANGLALVSAIVAGYIVLLLPVESPLERETQMRTSLSLLTLTSLLPAMANAQHATMTDQEVLESVNC